MIRCNRMFMWNLHNRYFMGDTAEEEKGEEQDLRDEQKHWRHLFGYEHEEEGSF